MTRQSITRHNNRAGVVLDRRKRVEDRLLRQESYEKSARRRGGGVKGMVKSAHILAAEGKINSDQERRLIARAGKCAPKQWVAMKLGFMKNHRRNLTGRHASRHQKGA